MTCVICSRPLAPYRGQGRRPIVCSALCRRRRIAQVRAFNFATAKPAFERICLDCGKAMPVNRGTPRKRCHDCADAREKQLAQARAEGRTTDAHKPAETAYTRQWETTAAERWVCVGNKYYPKGSVVKK